jgi:sugar lactone lactonase YvrE
MRITFLALLIAPGIAFAQAQAPNTINTIAGQAFGYNTSGNPLTMDLAGPSSVLEDGSGNLYVASPLEQWVYQWTKSTGTMTVFAGTGFISDHYEPGQANQDPLWNPYAVAKDAQGNIYIADTGNNVIRKVDSTGTQTVIAGNAKPCLDNGRCGDGGPATSAKLYNPQGVAVDSLGDVYIADTRINRVRVVGTDGIINAFAGRWGTVCQNPTDPCGDGGGAGGASLNGPIGLAVDAKNNVYIADTLDNRIRVVKGRNIFALAGNGVPCASGTNACGDGSAATSANLHFPQGVSVDANQNVYVADTADNRIRLVTKKTGVISTFAGTGNPGFSGDGGAASAAQVSRPAGVYVDSAHNLFIADSGNQRVRCIAGKTGACGGINQAYISTVIGGPVPNGGDGGDPRGATFANNTALAIDPSNNYYVADANNNRIRFVNVGTAEISTFAGIGIAGFTGDRGPAISATLNNPLGVGLDSSKNVYVADNLNRVVRCVAATGGACGNVGAGDINTVAGNGKSCPPGSGNSCGDWGPATGASLNGPTFIAFDPSGNMFIADPGSNKVRVVSNSTIQTFAGTGVCGKVVNGILATQANLCRPYGLAVDASANVYIAEAGNNVIRCVLGAPGGCGDTGNNYQVGEIITYAFSGGTTFNPQAEGGPATSATRCCANEVALDPRGNLFIGGGNDALVQRVDAQTQNIETIVGVPSQYFFYGFTGDGGPANKAHINNQGLAVDGNNTLLIADKGNNRVRIVNMIGVGTASPKPVDFGDQQVGTQSNPIAITLTNTGADDLIVSNIAVTGDFQQSNDCPLNGGQLEPTKTCTIQVTFTPSKKGLRKGALTITHNGYKGATVDDLTGTGT